MKIYLAHPISGESTDKIFLYYDENSRYYEDIGFEVLYPMIGKGYLRNELEFKAVSPNENPISTNKAIVGRDSWMVEQADIVLIDLTNAKRVSIGSVCELSWGWKSGKHTVVVMESDNIHRHAFVLEMADIVFETETQARKYLKKLIKGEF
jgi:nucleoside 2-deoxyribosyltransferase